MVADLKILPFKVALDEHRRVGDRAQTTRKFARCRPLSNLKCVRFESVNKQLIIEHAALYSGPLER